MKPIKTIEQLKKAATNENGDFTDFFILLAGGLVRSSKRILYNPETETFDVYNEIDDSEQDALTVEKLKMETHIVEAIENNCLYQYS